MEGTDSGFLDRCTDAAGIIGREGVSMPADVSRNGNNTGVQRCHRLQSAYPTGHPFPHLALHAPALQSPAVQDEESRV